MSSLLAAAEDEGSGPQGGAQERAPFRRQHRMRLDALRNPERIGNVVGAQGADGAVLALVTSMAPGALPSTVRAGFAIQMRSRRIC